MALNPFIVHEDGCTIIDPLAVMLVLQIIFHLNQPAFLH